MCYCIVIIHLYEGKNSNENSEYLHQRIFTSLYIIYPIFERYISVYHSNPQVTPASHYQNMPNARKIQFHKIIQVFTLRKQKGVQAGRFGILHKAWSSKSLELSQRPSHPPR